MSDDSSVEKAVAYVGDLKNSFLVLKSGPSGDYREAIHVVSVLEDSWSMKDRRSVQLVGVGY